MSKAKLSRCVRCGSADLESRVVERLIRGGNHVAAMQVEATSCHHCGERYFPKEVVERLELTREKLEDGDLHDFRSVGQLLTLVDARV